MLLQEATHYNSILSTIYPLIPVGRYTIQQLHSHPELIENSWVEMQNISLDKLKDDLKVMDFITPYNHQIEDQLNLTFKFDIAFHEIAPSRAGWKKLISKFSERHKETSVASDPAMDGFNCVSVFAKDPYDGVFSPVNAKSKKTFYDSPEVEEYRFSLSIYTEKIRTSADIASPNKAQTNRTALIARELIGGYRHLISVFLYYIKLNSRGPSFWYGDASQADYHATVEDACRLICNIHHLRDWLSSYPGIDISSLNTDQIWQHFSNIHSDLNQAITQIANQYVIDREIVKRKVLELAFYHSLRSHKGIASESKHL